MGDPGMVQARKRARFPLEARSSFFSLEELFRQDLDRHIAPELRVPCPVHLAHPARAERREDLVGAELRSSGERHLSPSTT